MGEPNNRHACAACKHQRRKCEPTCVLAPYFPARDRNEEFLAVHKVFGVSNITKMLSDIDERARDEAIKSFTWEASAWMQDRVHGPLGLYRKLQQELQEMKLKLEILEQQIRQQQALHCNSELGLLGVTPPEGNTSEERRACIITNNEETIPNYYYNLHQGQGVNCIAAPSPPALPQYTVVQGQKRVKQGRRAPIAQAITLAVPGTAAERGQRVVNQSRDSENIASIHPYIRDTLILEQESLRAASYNTPAHYQGNNSYPGGEESTSNRCSFWQGQGTVPNCQREGHINIAQTYPASQGSSRYLWPSFPDNLVKKPKVGQNVNEFAFQRQQEQRILNTNQFHYIQDQNKLPVNGGSNSIDA